MTKDVALIIKGHATQAIRELTSILYEIRGNCSEEEFEIIKRGVGRSLGDIQMDILEIVNRHYPELDDLKDL